MSPFSQLPCWVIMDCAENKECPAKENQNLNCWEIFGVSDCRSFNICRDCIVYISRQEQSSVTQSEMEEIMLKKGIIVSPCGAFTLSVPGQDTRQDSMFG